MLLDKRLWDGASPVTWESIKKMYDCNQSSPIDSAIMDRCIKAFNQSAQPGRLLLDTRFFKTLSTFCLCSEGKCKYKGTFPLDSAMSACGHHDVSPRLTSLMCQTRFSSKSIVFFPIQVLSHWMAVFIEWLSETMILFDPCGLWQASNDTMKTASTSDNYC